jgi:hypothetical protein
MLPYKWRGSSAMKKITVNRSDYVIGKSSIKRKNKKGQAARKPIPKGSPLKESRSRKR